ncbi:MAG: flagellar hook-length control protein FliK, partial [Treponemataceae bacterium]|nr:flagellar hook-length control protein FliK [Treponemataceae bacterium]
FEPALKHAGDFSSENAISAKSKRDSKIGVIEVKDFRTNAEAAQTEAKDLKKDFVRAPQNDSQGGGIELTMDLAANGEKNILSLDSQSAAADGSNFQAMLKNQITQNAGEFVRAGNIVLRDNDSGTINLVLHPESLGNVKIGLELSGKTVMGHIVVASREAFNAFGDGADVLRNAFIQSGFEDAKFDVSFAGSEMQFAQQNRGGQDDDSSMRQGKKIYGEFVEENISVGFENADKNIGNVLSSSNSIDVVA